MDQVKISADAGIKSSDANACADRSSKKGRSFSFQAASDTGNVEYKRCLLSEDFERIDSLTTQLALFSPGCTPARSGIACTTEGTQRKSWARRRAPVVAAVADVVATAAGCSLRSPFLSHFVFYTVGVAQLLGCSVALGLLCFSCTPNGLP